MSSVRPIALPKKRYQIYLPTMSHLVFVKR